jgi:hypothetical protein
MGRPLHEAALFGAVIGLVVGVGSSGARHWPALVRVSVSMAICAAVSLSLYWWLQSRHRR